MKINKLLLTLAMVTVSSVAVAQVKVGDNPTTINPNSVLEIESTNKGLLLPRVALTATTAAAPLLVNVAGMTVYNTATAGDVTPGYYYNNGTVWVRIADASVADVSKDAWQDNAANGLVELSTLSDGATARPAGTEFVALDNGNVGIGTVATNTGFVQIGEVVTNNSVYDLAIGDVDGNNTARFALSNSTAVGQTDIATIDISAGVGSSSFSQFANSASSSSSNALRVNESRNEFSLTNGTGTDRRSLIMTIDDTADLTPAGARISSDFGPNDVNANIDFFNGNIGIGTDAPTASLDVDGNARVRTLPAGVAADGVVTTDVNGNLRQRTAAEIVAAASADESRDGWENNFPGNRIELSTLSDGATARPAGSEVVILDNGRVGIGVTSPGRNLEVAGSQRIVSDAPIVQFSESDTSKEWYLVSEGNAIGFREGSTSVNNTRLRIADGGNVGIGVLNPSERLEVNGNIEIGTVSGASAGNALRLVRRAAGGGSNGVSSVTTIQDGTASGLILSGNGDAGNGSANNHVFVEQNTGDVGIGTTATRSKLTITGNIDNATGFNRVLEPLSNDGNIAGYIGTSAEAGASNKMVYYSSRGSANSGHLFSTFAVPTGAMYIRNNGNVGVGTLDPTQRLDVAGEAVFRGGSGGGNGTTGFGAAGNQISFGFNNSSNFRHAIRTRHSSTSPAGNSIDFIVHNPSVDAQGADPTARVMSITTRGTTGLPAVGIGAAEFIPTQLLDVRDGNISVTGGSFIDDGTTLTTPDYVFEKYYKGTSNLKDTYTFKSLKSIENFVKENNHLPGTKSAAQIKEDGWDLSFASRFNLEKVEELFLHTIAQEKKLEMLTKENAKLKERLAKIEAALNLNKK